MKKRRKEESEATAQRRTHYTPQRLKPSPTETLYFALNSSDPLRRAEAKEELTCPLAGTHMGFAGTREEFVGWCSQYLWNRHGGIFGVHSNSLQDGDLGDEHNRIEREVTEPLANHIDREDPDLAAAHKHGNWEHATRGFMERLGEFVEGDTQRADEYAALVKDTNIRWADNQHAWYLIQFAASQHADADVIFDFVAEAWAHGLDFDDKEFKRWRDRQRSRKRQNPDPLDRVYEFASEYDGDGNFKDDERDSDIFSVSYGRESTAPFSAGRTTSRLATVSREQGERKHKVPQCGARIRTNDDQNDDREQAIDMVAEKHPHLLPMFIDQLDGMTYRQIAEKHGLSKTTVERKLDRALRDVFPAYKTMRDIEAVQRELESMWDQQERWASDQGIDLYDLGNYEDLSDYSDVTLEAVIA